MIAWKATSSSARDGPAAEKPGYRTAGSAFLAVPQAGDLRDEGVRPVWGRVRLRAGRHQPGFIGEHDGLNPVP
jgi:hypothetical protein